MGEFLFAPDCAVGRCSGWCVGAQLCTKDGRKCGNAVIAEPVINVLKRQSAWLVFTDAGNEMVLNEEELKELFYRSEWRMEIARAPGYKRWMETRHDV